MPNGSQVPKTKGAPFQFKVDPRILLDAASSTQVADNTICSVIFSVFIGSQEVQTKTFVERQQPTGKLMTLDFARAFIYPPMTPPLVATTEETVASQSFRAVDYVMTPPSGDGAFDDPKTDFVDFAQLDKSRCVFCVFGV